MQTITSYFIVFLSTVKKKFKFLGHKRTGSSDSKVSQNPFSFLGRSKQSSNDQNNLCINGSHVYAEETEPKSGSTLSLNSSGQGSVEDVRRHNSDVSADSLKDLAVPSYRESTDRATVEQQRHQEEEERRQAEAKRLHGEEERRYQEEQERRQKLKEEEETRRKKLREEEEMRRKKLKEEDDGRRKKLKEEEEERRKQEGERRRLEAAESQRLEEERERLDEEKRRQEEAQRAEEQKRQEEASMSDRLSSLFGMIRKKEEKKEEMSSAQEEAPQPAPRTFPRDLEVPGSHRHANPFEEIPLSPDRPDEDHQKAIRNPQPPSAMVFLNRIAKVSAVKPR